MTNGTSSQPAQTLRHRALLNPDGSVTLVADLPTIAIGRADTDEAVELDLDAWESLGRSRHEGKKITHGDVRRAGERHTKPVQKGA